MTREWDNSGPEERDEQVRLICGESIAAGGPLMKRLAHDDALRESLEADRELVESLRAALRPTALAPATERRILERAGAELGAGRRAAVWRSRASLLLAAAAALLLGVVWPAETLVNTSEPTIELSPEDSSAIVAAVGEVGWNSLVDYSAESVASRVDALQKEVQPSGDTSLSWDADEAWDLPVSPKPSGQTEVELRRSIS